MHSSIVGKESRCPSPCIWGQSLRLAIIDHLITITNQRISRNNASFGYLDIFGYYSNMKHSYIPIGNDESTCNNGHLEVVDWLYDLSDIHIHTNEDEAFRTDSRNGHFEVVRQYSYSSGHLAIAQMVYVMIYERSIFIC
jgi:hypothetical protein